MAVRKGRLPDIVVPLPQVSRGDLIAMPISRCPPNAC